VKLLLEHRLPKKLRYAKVYFEAGSASVFFSLDGASADWHASIGKTKKDVEMTDGQYARLREAVPAVELLDDDGRNLIVRNAAGYDEQWQKPRWVLRRVHRKGSSEG
jgi:hypothetical protein